MEKLKLEMLTEEDFINCEKELTRIAIESIWETRHIYEFYAENKKNTIAGIPEVRLTQFQGGNFLPPATLLIDEDLENPLFTLLHETGHFIRYNKFPKPWEINKLQVRGVEEIIAELHAIQFADSRGILNHYLKIELEENRSETSRYLNRIANELHRQNPKVLSILVKMNYDQSTDYIERAMYEKGLIEKLGKLCNPWENPPIIKYLKTP